MAKDIRSPVAICRAAIVVLGIILMGVGLHSHFQSGWTKAKGDGRKAFCEAGKALDKTCPKISLEQFYVAMIIITFIISLACLAAFFFMELEQFKMIDMGYHAVAAFLLFIAAIVYIVSAQQISSLASALNGGGGGGEGPPGGDPWGRQDWGGPGDGQGSGGSLGDGTLKGEKIAAAALTIIHAMLFGVASFLVWRQ